MADVNGGGESLRRKQMALGQLFARAQDEDNDGLSSGFLEGTNHQKVVIGRSPRHRGVFAGTVASVSKRSSSVLIDLPRDESKRVTIKTGDGLVFDGGRPESEEAGGTVVRAFQRKDQVQVDFRKHATDFSGTALSLILSLILPPLC